MALYRVVYDFEGQESSELTVKKGEVLVARGPDADDWLPVARQCDPTSSGYVPLGYVERIESAGQAPAPAPPAASLFDFPTAQQSFPAPLAADLPAFGFGVDAGPPAPGQSAFAFPPDLPSAFGGSRAPFGGSIPAAPTAAAFDFPAPSGISGSLFGASPEFALGRTPPFTDAASGHAGGDGSPPFGFAPQFAETAAAAPPPAPPPEETWSFPGGLPRMPLPPPTAPVLYPVLPAVQPIESLRVYEEAFEAQPPGPSFAEVDAALEEATAALQRLTQQHSLASAQLQLVRSRLEVEGGIVRRQRAAVTAAQPIVPLAVHEVEPDPLPAVEFTYQKFLTPGKNYMPASAPAAPPAVGASPLQPPAPAPSAVPDFSSMSPPEPSQCPPEEDSPAELERHSFELLQKAAVAVQEVRDRCEAMALTPLTEASDVDKVVNARKAYDELLLQQMMKVDAVDSHGISSIRMRRKELLRDIEQLHHNLDELIKREMELARG